MGTEEILCTRYGEMLDMLNCHAVFNGTAKEKRKLSFDEVLRLR